MNLFITLATLASMGATVYARPEIRKSDPSIMIVGGTEARQGQFPYQLEMLYGSYHMCGASLVQVSGIQVAITAAHCLFDQDPKEYQLIAGELDQSQISGFEQTRNVSRIISHPDFNPYLIHNDIAIMFFDPPFELNNNAKLISLPNKFEEVAEGKNITVSGWGDLWYGGVSPNVLQYVEIPVVSNEQCKASWSEDIGAVEILESQLCAGESTGTVSPCHGDSGGPAVSESGQLAGIVSWGKDCGHKDYPGVFTKVSHFVGWVEATVENYKVKGA